MHNGTILAQEVTKLRAQLGWKQEKQAILNMYTASETGMIGDNMLQLMVDSQLGVGAESSGAVGLSSVAKLTNQGAPPRCTNCWQVGHKRTRCPK